jgi:ribose transport system ATP-binding protein
MHYPSVRALDDVSLQLFPGEILAIVGENGAGKSTLMKILAGVQLPTQGEMCIDGQQVVFAGVADAIHHGIAFIHQELNLAGNLDVGANLFLGREPHKWGFIDRSALRQASRQALERVGLELSPQIPVESLPIGKQQLVEIAKALSTRAQVLIMDEPTSSLSQQESDHLLQVVRDLRSRGVSILYVSHRLGEVEALADRVLILRDGKMVEVLSGGQINRHRMTERMVGRELSQFYQRSAHTPGPEVLSVQGLQTAAHPQHPIDFSLRAGEMVGVAGLVGAGRTELLTTLFGISPATGGSLVRGILERPPRNVQEAISAGIMLVPEDRRLAGLVLAMNVKQNLSLASLRREQHWGLLNFPAEERISVEMTRLLQIRTASDRQRVQTLSGGNQQKVVLGKWLAMHPTVLLLDEPTRGIDVGAKHEIYQHMHQLAAQGVGILFVSSDMEELLSLSDRVLTMHEGRLTGQLEREELSEQTILRLATGEVPTVNNFHPMIP